jgi:3-oxoacyl-[acyl-carrier-protein] synthase III
VTQRSGVAVVATGSSVPSRVLTNADFLSTLDTSDEWIVSRTGIKERRVVSPGETAATLGTAAADAALQKANLTPEQIDLIVVATVTPDLMCPSTACLIQGTLGCRPIPAFDVSAACSGFVYALATGDAFVRSGMAQHALVIGAEALTRVADYADRNTCILFGDAAGAVVLKAVPEDSPAGIKSFHLFADGTKQELIQVPSMVTPNPPPGKNALPDLRWLRMNGREVFKFAVTKMAELISKGLAEAAALGLEITLIVPHQVNSRIIDAATETAGFPRDRVMMNLDRYGNSSAASVPLAFDEAVREGRCGPGDTVLLVAFGGGLTWSSALLTL